MGAYMYGELCNFVSGVMFMYLKNSKLVQFLQIPKESALVQPIEYRQTYQILMRIEEYMTPIGMPVL